MNKQIIFLSSLLAIGTGLTFECHGARFARTLNTLRLYVNNMSRFAKFSTVAGVGVAASSNNNKKKATPCIQHIQFTSEKGVVESRRFNSEAMSERRGPWNLTVNRRSGNQRTISYGYQSEEKNGKKVDLEGLTPFFTYFVPDNYNVGESPYYSKPKVTISLINLTLDIDGEESSDGNTNVIKGKIDYTLSNGNCKSEEYHIEHPTIEKCKKLWGKNSEVIKKCIAKPVILKLPRLTDEKTPRLIIND